jgi:hypothetical protein
MQNRDIGRTGGIHPFVVGKLKKQTQDFMMD